MSERFSGPIEKIVKITFNEIFHFKEYLMNPMYTNQLEACRHYIERALLRTILVTPFYRRAITL